MDQNPPILAKKVWSLIHAIFYIFKKTISKTRFFADLNMIIKRGKLAGKTLHNLLFHHHRNWAASTSLGHPHHLPFPTPPPSEDEFSCTTTPQHPFSDLPTIKKHQSHQPGYVDAIDEIVIDPSVIKVVERLRKVAESPRFEKSPLVKQLRITDSPFPMNDGDGDDDHVDEDAERFIMKFYNGLKQEIE